MQTKAKAFAAFLCISLLVASSGCKRSEDASDTRTLEQRPHTETVRPVDRSDAFRP